jgi:hypothetical protein
VEPLRGRECGRSEDVSPKGIAECWSLPLSLISLEHKHTEEGDSECKRGCQRERQRGLR